MHSSTWINTFSYFPPKLYKNTLIFVWRPCKCVNSLNSIAKCIHGISEPRIRCRSINTERFMSCVIYNWSTKHLVCYKAGPLFPQNNSSVLLSPTCFSLAHIDCICVVLFGAAGVKGSKVNGCRASSTRQPPVSEANMRHIYWRRKFHVFLQTAPVRLRFPFAVLRSIPTERGQACIMTLTSQDSLD